MQQINEQRLTVRLRKHWDLLRKLNPMPLAEHFNPAPLEDVWPQCLYISVDTHAHSGIAYKCEYMGMIIQEVYGRDLTGRMMDNPHTKQFPGGVMHKKLDEVVGTRQPADDGGYMINKDGNQCRYRACFLPFGNEQKGVTHIVAGLSFRLV